MEGIGYENLSKSLQNIARGLEIENYMDSDKLANLVESSNVKLEDLEPWAEFNHSQIHSYGRRMLHKGRNFEIMLMSWYPEDFSSIHDHGYANWGIVQAHGNFEHAVFKVSDEHITTVLRENIKSSNIIKVSNELIHQLGNPSNNNILSLHIYGRDENKNDITSHARIFDLDENKVQRADGGMFLALPEPEIKVREQILKPDYATWLRHTTELIKRLQKAKDTGIEFDNKNLEDLISKFLSKDKFQEILTNLEYHTDLEGYVTDTKFWKLFKWELIRAAELHIRLSSSKLSDLDSFSTYAIQYDAIIGQPCLDDFTANYINFFKDKYNIDFTTSSLLSVGCGTALTELYMQNNLGIKHNDLLGIDVSEAMVKVAQKRINAKVGDVLKLQTNQKWDLIYIGLNALQYLPHDKLELSIKNLANELKIGGYFFGDFVTSDHIRNYPNLLTSKDKTIISLRTPKLIEKDGFMYQCSEIVNLNSQGESLKITYEGKHYRYLPTISKIRGYFENSFKGKVDLYDAVSLKVIKDTDDTCSSTRYIIIAQKE